MSDITFEVAGEQMKEIINAVGKHSFGILVKKAYNATDAADVLLAIKKDYGPTLRALIRTDNKIEAIRFVRFEAHWRGVDLSVKDVKEFVESIDLNVYYY